jgi:hypothetical protein
MPHWTCSALLRYTIPTFFSSLLELSRVGEAELAARVILKDTPEALDAAFGLRRLRGHEGDAKLRESAAELGGLALAGEFFFERPVGIAPGEDSATVAIESNGHTEAAEQALEQAEIALGGFCEEELSSKDRSGGIVLHVVIIGGVLQENPFFVPPDRFLDDCETSKVKSSFRALVFQSFTKVRIAVSSVRQ